ncbi:hypothetical protein AYX15_06795 [Cryptococcus neoformans]|nr:hypothetical protein AYX15_06795 [Cryptococcus neoformans var. grubii]
MARNPSKASEATINSPANPFPASPPWPPLESPNRPSTPLPDDWELNHSKRVDDMVQKLYKRSKRSLPQFPPHLEAFTCISPLSPSLSPPSPNLTPTPLITSVVSNNPQTASSQSVQLPNVFLCPTWSTISTRDNSLGLRETRSVSNLPRISSIRVSTLSPKTNFNATAKADDPAEVVSEKGQKETMYGARSIRADDSKASLRLADAIKSAQQYVKQHQQKKSLHFLSVQTVPQSAMQKSAPPDSSRQQRDLQTNQRFRFGTPSTSIPTFHSSTFNPQKLPSSGPFRVSKSSADVARLSSSPYATSTRCRPWSPPNSPPSTQNLKLDMANPTRLRKGKSTSSLISSGSIVYEAAPGTGRSEYQRHLKLRTPITPRQTPDWVAEPSFQLNNIPSNRPLFHASFANSNRTSPIIPEPPHLTGTNQASSSTSMSQRSTEPTSIPITSSSTPVIIRVHSDNLTSDDPPRINNVLKSPVILQLPSSVKPKTSHTSLSTAAIQKNGNPIRKKISTAINKAKSHCLNHLKRP